MAELADGVRRATRRLRDARRAARAADVVATRPAREAGRAARRGGLLAAVDRARPARDRRGLRAGGRSRRDRRRRGSGRPAGPPRAPRARAAPAAQVVDAPEPVDVTSLPQADAPRPAAKPARCPNRPKPCPRCGREFRVDTGRVRRARPRSGVSSASACAWRRPERRASAGELLEREAEHVGERLRRGGAHVVDRHGPAELACHRRELVAVEAARRDPVGERRRVEVDVQRVSVRRHPLREVDADRRDLARRRLEPDAGQPLDAGRADAERAPSCGSAPLRGRGSTS